MVVSFYSNGKAQSSFAKIFSHRGHGGKPTDSFTVMYSW